MEVKWIGDERVSLLAELISNMKLVKLYAWEAYFSAHVQRVRAAQVRHILRQSFVSAANRCLGLTVPLIVSLATFATFVAEEMLTPATPP
jgi:hypothetical protein